METYRANTEQDMMALGAELFPRLKTGDILLLTGDLGAGKTTLTRGIIRAAGHTGPVRSPTFTLVNEYATNPPICHVDLYRVKSAEGLGLEEYSEDHILIVEWPDRWQIRSSDEGAWEILITHQDDKRTVQVIPPKDRAY